MSQCKFDICWNGQCKKETNNDYCQEHTQIKCDFIKLGKKCNNQAISHCSQFAGSFVCGAPRCKEHQCNHSNIYF